MTTTLRGKWVFDSNLLVYFLDQNSPFFETSKKIFLLQSNRQLDGVIAHQNILEAERTLIKDYKLNKNEVFDSVSKVVFSFNFEIISPMVTTLEKYHELIETSTIKIDIFDYYLAATMLDNGINRILTGNTKDFSKIPGIEAVNPFK